MKYSPLRLVFVLWLVGLSSWAQALVFAVNEGVTYRVGSEEIRARYAAIAADLSTQLGQPVRVEPVSDYPTLRRGLADKSYDLALVHPTHISILAIKNSGYRLVAVTKGYTEYAARFLVRADSPLKSLAELRERRCGAPEEDSITAWITRATLRDALGGDKRCEMTYTRYQDAVPFMVEHTFTHVGATASNAVVKDWESKGGRVLARSRPVPIKHVIASPALSAEQVERLRGYFTTLDASEAGRKKLETLKVSGYTSYDTAALLDLGRWLGL
ncbi:Phosphate ABC transporter substrate-binding protein [Rubrivivax sp. A210]|uniref:phosphate/phosphite/phosphonate ABC transporter substrate-binding protein n=1 Tax=Rubrivivax sp. A210 TaxID=2772301 RepID=UPI0019191158|nr:PhnD/SsuA/transferrin family substrate-binding protein [Rubrivivax sp. A210]CAD5371807.1 Phosphate ABC transporter substrate-binding protein [Rubrivivax sp. A210]